MRLCDEVGKVAQVVACSIGDEITIPHDAMIVALLTTVLPALNLTPMDGPPVLNSPVYSLATKNADGTTNMQILTYATPAGVQPRMWAISLYKPTKTYSNFVAQRTGVLQQLCDSHANLVYTLGGRSGADVDKAAACAEAGFPWSEANGDAEMPQLLPGCATYLRLVQVGDLVSCGEHEVAVCRVEAMLEEEGGGDKSALMTAPLRAAGIITDRGKAIEPGSQ